MENFHTWTRTRIGVSSLFFAAIITTLVSCKPASNKIDIKEKASPDVLTSGQSWCFSGGPIYTAIDANPKIDAVAVKDGKITYAGADQGPWCLDQAGQGARQYDLNGAALYPGFVDGHAHLLGIGMRELTLNLEGTKSVKDLQARLAGAIATTSKGEVLYGRGWIETHWPENRFPNRQDLDAVSPDNPIILERADGHALVVNSAALAAANITRETSIPDGGNILKDKDGEPTGMLIDRADRLVWDLMSTPTLAQKKMAYKVASDLYASRGWTQVQAMSVASENVPLMQLLAKSNDLKIRVYTAQDISGGYSSDRFSTVQSPGALISRRAIKLYADGALGSRGAALLKPYDDDPDNSGLMLTSEAEIMPVLEKALRSGVQISTHAIGDKANEHVLDWYEAALKAVPPTERAVEDPRWRIEHAQILQREDILRFSGLGVIASMQPSHAIGDLHFAVDRIGPERLEGGYAWRSLIDSGAILVGGSDAPVEKGDPRIEFYAAIARQDLQGYSNANWYPDEKVRRQEALKILTAWPAYAAFQEDYLGTIEVGKTADFTVFGSDIMTIPAKEILLAEPLLTLVGGAVVFESALR